MTLLEIHVLGCGLTVYRTPVAQGLRVVPNRYEHPRRVLIGYALALGRTVWSLTWRRP